MAKNDKNEIGDKIIAMALAAFGIDPKFVAGSRYDEVTEEAIIVTVGGKKVRFKDGDKVEKLSQIEITGINPAPKRKPITGAGKEK
jgi:hypothetical protein